MRPGLAVVGFVVVAAAIATGASGKRSSAVCPASPADEDGGRLVVHAGVITGGIDPLTDVVDGRLRLRVGPYRDVTTGLTQKILWTVPADRRAADSRLVVRGKTIRGKRRTFVQKFWEAGTDDPTHRYYPSIISPSSAGCWRLTLTTGKLRNALVARVDG